MAKYDLTWTNGVPKPESYMSWGDWIRSITYDTVYACERLAQTPRQVLHRNPATGYASLTDNEAFRSITHADIRRQCYRLVHGTLEEYCLLREVDWRVALEQIIVRTAERLEQRGYTLTD